MVVLLRFNLFVALMLEVEIWYNAMQSISLTVKKAELHIRNFQNSVARIRNSVVTNHESVNLSAAAKDFCDSVNLNAEKILFFWPLAHCIII